MKSINVNDHTKFCLSSHLKSRFNNRSGSLCGKVDFQFLKWMFVQISDIHLYTKYIQPISVIKSLVDRCFQSSQYHWLLGKRCPYLTEKRFRFGTEPTNQPTNQTKQNKTESNKQTNAYIQMNITVSFNVHVL